MKKNLLITLDYPPMRGGVARYLSGLTQYFDDQIRVVHDHDKLLYRFFWPRWLKTVLLLLRQSRTYRQVLVSHLLPMGTAAFIARLATRRPYIVFVHGMDVGAVLAHPRKRWLAGLILRSAKIVVTNSRALKEELEKYFGIKHVTVVYPNVALQEGILDKKNPTQEPEKPIELLTVARLVKRKGHAHVLNALAHLQKAFPHVKLHYTIVGDGPEYENIVRHISEQGLQGAVRIICDATDTQREAMYRASDIFVMPTLYTLEDREGFGMVYLEAASYGVPSIGTQHKGVDEAILNGQTGLLVPEDGSMILSDIILRLATDAQLRHRLGAAAKKRVQTEFTPERQWEKLRPYLW